MPTVPTVSYGNFFVHICGLCALHLAINPRRKTWSLPHNTNLKFVNSCDKRYD